MHQPFYKDLVTGEYKLPWTRLHALKDYYGMVKVLEDFPQVRQTFNLVPSMLVQIEEYASGRAFDPFLGAALKGAEDLTPAEQEFILQYFFQANPSRMIYRYPRYGELYDLWLSSGRVVARARRMMNARAFRDLQVLSQLAWFDEEDHEHDRAIRELVKKERDFTVDDQLLLGRKQTDAVARVIPVYAEFAARGQIEISTTPFYHPILPLICDSQIAEVAHPYVPLPTRFRYPQDARHQLATARSYMESKLDHAPAGLWPSEGSVSDEVLRLAVESGFQWFATDNGVLGRTLRQDPSPSITYKPYVWEQGGCQIRGIFRDHFLSDLVGFVYARMAAKDAAEHFLQQIRHNCEQILKSGRDALVPIILDGENAWEFYDLNGRPFLRELYKRLSDDPAISAVTVSEALSKVEGQRFDSIFPGSWINANFDIWIGAEEDNKAWEYLLRARQTYDRVDESGEESGVPSERKSIAYEELLIAEGSDWCWWYGPEHDSANRAEFDALFRGHLANVYKLLKLAPPDELSRPILKVAMQEFHLAPTGPVKATVDGEVTSYFEWLGAGVYRVDNRSGAMHGHRFFVQELRYGSDGQHLFLRLDFVESSGIDPALTELRVNILPSHKAASPVLQSVWLSRSVDGIECAVGKVCEVRVPLASAGVPLGHDFRFQISLWQGGLPVDALPPQGWIEFSTSESTEWLI
jgi:alpha-amylase/alpha-mannosidase (GH57 family)